MQKGTQYKMSDKNFYSSIVDPLGMISPAIFEPKILMQKFWKCDIY